jgi:hypothetical protein
LEEFPPGHRVLEHLEKDRERMRERIVTAQLTAFVELLKSLESLTKPTRVQVRISQDGADELTRFWESGAFERLRGLLGLLREMLASDDRTQVLGVHRRLRLAQAAWYSGDPEGCLFHAACALSRQLALPVGELEASLPHDERSPTAAAALRALDAELRGEQALDLAALTAPALADLASDTAMPTSRERGMTGQELYELLAQDLPHVPLEDE